MVADAFDHRAGAAIANGKAFGRSAAIKRLASSRAIETHVAHDDVILGDKTGILGGIDHQPTTGESLADVIVGVSLQFQCDSLG